MEIPTSAGAAGTSSSMLSGMFNFMKPSRGAHPAAPETEGMYLAELATGAIDPEVAALYFPPSQGHISLPNGESKWQIVEEEIILKLLKYYELIHLSLLALSYEAPPVISLTPIV